MLVTSRWRFNSYSKGPKDAMNSESNYSNLSNNIKGVTMSRRKKEERQEEAIERQERYDNLSIKQKIDLAKSRPGKSLKEIRRLEKLNAKS